ncbi:MAG: Ig-like domain-containing protein, partial [Clostridia bacterium]|nr:Ig-like domain-containing protein [Clostridia bacterium]
MPTRPGYVFDGWYYGLDQLTTETCELINAYTYAQDIEIESHWIEIELELNNYHLLFTDSIGGDMGIIPTVTPQGSSTVTFTSSNKDIVEVDQDGNFVIKGIGKAYIRVTLDNGGAYKECLIESVDVRTEGSFGGSLLFITINGEIYGREHAVMCKDTDSIKTISGLILKYLKIENEYVDRTDIGIEIVGDAKFEDIFRYGDTLNINLIYSIEKATNTHVSYRLSANTAEFGQKVYLEDLIAKEGYKLGNIIVTNEKDLDVEISQLERSFVMPGANVLVDVLLKTIEVESTTIDNISIKSDTGIKSNAKFVINTIDKDSYNQNITFSEFKQSVYAMHIDYIEDEMVLDYGEKYTITMNVPKEFIGKDGMEVLYYQNGETIVKQVYIEGDTLTLTLAGSGDIVFISNIHKSTVYLYWLIILMLFIDALLGMIVIILFINYQDALQRRRELNGYSTVLPVLLLGAAIASEIAFLVFLGLIFLVELIAIAWLSLKLTNKYFIYTTYHKMSYVKPQDYNTVVKDNRNRQQNE